MIKALDNQPRSRRSRILLVLGLIGSLAGIAIALTSLRMESGLFGVAIAGLAVVLSVAALLASRRWWGEADEAVREAHKTGWYWGGSGGLAVAGGIMAALFALEPDVSLRQFAILPGDAGLMATGMAVTIGLAFLGYGVGWAVWWLVRGR